MKVQEGVRTRPQASPEKTFSTNTCKIYEIISSL
jgi:hypothetical protein